MARISQLQGSERFLWVLFVASVIATYNWYTIREYRAQRLADSLDQSAIEKAVRLQPKNATYHDLLCRSMIFVTREPTQAIDECRKAAALNPYSSSYWLDLAQAYLSAGNRLQYLDAIHNAIVVDPTTPDTAWNAANFLLIQGDVPNALKEFGVALRGDPTLATPVLNICWQTLHDTVPIQKILPPNPDIYLTFINLLLSNGEPTAAHQIWTSLIQLNQPFDYRHALLYVDSLLQSRNIDEASDVWKQVVSRSTELRGYSRPGDLIEDGSFSHEILNSGFAWHYTPRPNILAILDANEFHSDGRSLLLTYSDTGGDAGIFQYIAVQPDTRYRLVAWVKSQDLSTANGPRIALSDAFDNKVYLATDETTGTTDWHRLESLFQTGPQTKLLILTILRSPAETRIQGQFWLDDISLQAM